MVYVFKDKYCLTFFHILDIHTYLITKKIRYDKKQQNEILGINHKKSI